MRYFGDKRSVRGLDLELMARRAVDRSRGQLVEIILEGSSTNELLNYIGDRYWDLEYYSSSFLDHKLNIMYLMYI